MFLSTNLARIALKASPFVESPIVECCQKSCAMHTCPRRCKLVLKKSLLVLNCCSLQFSLNMYQSPILHTLPYRKKTQVAEPTTKELLDLLESATQEVLSATATSSGRTSPVLTRKNPAIRNLCRIIDSLLSKK